MAEGTYYPPVRAAAVPKDDPYVAFKDIFGQEPPPGRIPRNQSSGGLSSLFGSSRSRQSSTTSNPKSASSLSLGVAPDQPVAARQGSTSSGGSQNNPTGSTNLGTGATYGGGNGSQASVAANAGSQAGNNPYGIAAGQNLAQNARNPSNASYSGQGITRSVSQVFSGFKQNVAPRSLSSTGTFTKQRASDQRTMSLTTSGVSATTRGGRAIPNRGSNDTFGLPHASAQSTSDQSTDTTAVSRKASSSTINSLSTLARSTIVTTSRKEPLVYPAFLSKVAAAFQNRISIDDRLKNELTYKNSFTGSDAVDIIAYIIATPDRNLALLLGRALDAQKFFHDVTYDNRLRDSPNEIYQFSHAGTTPQALPERAVIAGSETTSPANDTGVNGVFTLLAECYSPTCTRDKLCYSISCPRRLEQQARLNMKLDPGLQSLDSKLHLQQTEDEQRKLWIYTVPAEIAEKVPKEEQKRQEVIYELVYTERDFVKNLEYIRDFWIKPLRRTNIIPESRRDRFIRAVFLNILEIHDVNINLAEALSKLQQQSPVVQEVAHVMIEHAANFEPFIRYGALQLYGKYEFEREVALNPAFAKFVEETERLPESKKLELNGYLSKPTTRLARYPLLLDAILKHTSTGNPDFENLPVAIAKIREFLIKVNEESGRTENRFALAQLNQYLQFRAGEYLDLKLTDEKRQLVYEGNLQRKPGEGELHIYLFDHALLMVKNKTANKREVLKVSSRPIPLELLRVSDNEEVPVQKGSTVSLTSGSTFRKGPSMIRGGKNIDAYPITFQHLGRRGYDITLYAPSFQARKSWIDQISRQLESQRKLSDVYAQHKLQSSFFGPTNRVTCARPFDGGRKLLYGTAQGIYLSDISYEQEGSDVRTVSRPALALQMPNVIQLDVLDIYGILLFLADKTIYSLSLELLEGTLDSVGNVKRAKFVANQATFYKVDECMGRTLLSVVKSHSLSATIRVLEPTDMIRPSQKRPPLRRLLTAGGGSLSEGFKPFKPPVEVPAAMLSISYLRRHLCLGCSKGFELLGLNTLKIESLLDPADTSLDFVIKKDSLRPISIYRIGKEFLLNYSEFSFFINQDGWRSRPEWMIQWESEPHHIVLSYPYLIAFEPNFIEIRNMDTELLRAITGDNIRFLHESTHEILYVHENDDGFDEVVALNFWEKQRRVEKV